MPKISFWRNQKGNNYKFIDFHVKQQFDIAGTLVNVHKYLGPVEPGNTKSEIREPDDISQPNFLNDMNDFGEAFGSDETDIQDLFYLENRDRKYDQNVYELRGHYTLQDSDFDLRQFGLMLSVDTIYITFHYNDMIARLGRKLMSGDVIELPHLRDTDLLDEEAHAINKYYVVEDASRAAEGYDQHWLPHIWRCRCVPMQNQQEFFDILDKEGTDYYGDPVADGATLGEMLSTLDIELEIDAAVDDEADRQVPKRYFDHSMLYILPTKDGKSRNHAKNPICLWYGDGEPPNGAVAIGQGKSFPDDVDDGEYFLRTDYRPHVLFKRKGHMWVREEVDNRSRWSQANDLLKSFINHQNDVDAVRYPEDTRQYKIETITHIADGSTNDFIFTFSAQVVSFRVIVDDTELFEGTDYLLFETMPVTASVGENPISIISHVPQINNVITIYLSETPAANVTVTVTAKILVSDGLPFNGHPLAGIDSSEEVDIQYNSTSERIPQRQYMSKVIKPKKDF